MDPELDGRLQDAAAQLAKIRREARGGAPLATSLLGLLSLSTDLHSYVIEQTANLMKGTRR